MSCIYRDRDRYSCELAAYVCQIDRPVSSLTRRHRLVYQLARYYSTGHLIIRSRKAGPGRISCLRMSVSHTNFSITTAGFLSFL